MSEISKYEAYKKKLQGICDENDLIFRFKRDKYPITLTIRPAGGMDAQISMLENTDENGYTSPDAAIIFTFKDGALSYKTSKTFTISDALFSKIKNLFKNMHYTWLQFFYRDVIERGVLERQQMPQIDEDEVDYPEGAEPLESFDDEMPEVDFPDDYEEEANSIDAGDPLVVKATQIVRHENKATLALLQRHLQIGIAKATQLMQVLEALGVVGTTHEDDPLEVLPYDEPDELDEIEDDASEGYKYEDET